MDADQDVIRAGERARDRLQRQHVRGPKARAGQRLHGAGRGLGLGDGAGEVDLVVANGVHDGLSFS
jgi:hypothetical protein